MFNFKIYWKISVSQRITITLVMNTLVMHISHLCIVYFLLYINEFDGAEVGNFYSVRVFMSIVHTYIYLFIYIYYYMYSAIDEFDLCSPYLFEKLSSLF